MPQDWSKTNYRPLYGMVEHKNAVLNFRSHGTGPFAERVDCPYFDEKVRPRALSSLNILETVQFDDLMEVRARRFLVVSLVPLLVLVAAWPIKHLGDTPELGCFMQRFERLKIQIGKSIAVSTFEITRRMLMSNCPNKIDQSQGLALS